MRRTVAAWLHRAGGISGMTGTRLTSFRPRRTALVAPSHAARACSSISPGSDTAATAAAAAAAAPTPPAAGTSAAPDAAAAAPLSKVVTTATFESDIMQSLQGVILIFHIPSAGCMSFIKMVEQAAAKLNAAGSGRWAKVCVINADENVNLASVFSVERARLPVTYFLYHATIIDKVTGQVQQQRCEAILHKFHEYYLKQHGTDVSAAVVGRGGQLVPEGETLTDAVPTHHLQQRIHALLVGAERVQLPEDAEKMADIKKLIQQAKKQAVSEVRDLYNSLGMDVKRLSAEEVATQFHASPAFVTAGIISALEALFLARICGAASSGTVRAADVEAALVAVEKDFEPLQGDPTVKKIVLLTYSLLERHRALIKLEALVALPANQAQIGAGEADVAAGSGGATRTSADSGPEAEAEFWKAVIRWAEFVDARVLPSVFPREMADELFAVVKRHVVLARKSNDSRDKLRAAKQLLLMLVQHYAGTADAQAARARLSSIMF